MKKLVLGALLLASVSGSAFASHGGEDWVRTSKLLVGNPVGDLAALTCPDPAPTDGVSEHFILLPEGAPGHTLTVTAAQRPDVNDYDVYFYDAECGGVGGSDMANAGNEAGTIPEGAKWMSILLWTGANSTYTAQIYFAPSE